MVIPNPEVTVIIPAYNTEAYIGKSIQSALEQTLNNIEVIVVDDASSDQTLAVAKSFTDKRLKIIANQTNMGAAQTRNHALKQAKGKWIAVLDSDDWYAPERLEKLLSIAYAEDADMVADDLYHIQDGDKLPWSTLLKESGEQIDKIKQIDPIYFIETDLPGRGGLTLGLTKALLKKNFINHYSIQYEQHLKIGQDFWFYLKCLAHGARFIFVPEPYYFYRSRPGSLVTINQIERLEQYITGSLFFLEKNFIKNSPNLSNALSKRLKILQNSRVYFRIVDTYKKGKKIDALIEALYNPYVLLKLAENFPKIISRRMKYYFFFKKTK